MTPGVYEVNKYSILSNYTMSGGLGQLDIFGTSIPVDAHCASSRKDEIESSSNSITLRYVVAYWQAIQF